MKIFCGLVNMPLPLDQKTYDLINKRILFASSEIASASKKSAAEEEASLTKNRDIAVSCDGTWLIITAWSM